MRLISAINAGRGVTLIALALMVVAVSPSEAAQKRKRGPINAKVAVDLTRASAATITAAAGGTVSVRARNGTKMTVKFPPGAVAQDTLVSAAPVTRLASGPTRKGLLAGVQLQPEGLVLLKPATVSFARRGKAPKRTRLVFVGSQGDGRDLHLLPPPVRAKGRGKQRRFVPTGRPVVSITHFSTVDALDWSNATMADINAILYPELGVHRLSQELSKLLLDKDATEQDLIDAYERERKRFIDPLVQLSLARLKTGCSVAAIRGAKETLGIALSFSRQMELLGLGLDTSIPFLSEMLTEAAVCMVTLCPKAGDPTAGAFFVGLARQLQLLGAGNQALFDALIENMERCGAYEVRIDARINTSHPDSGAFSFRVVGKVKVVPSATAFAGETPRPRGPLEYTETSGLLPSLCHNIAISRTTNGEFELSEVSLTLFDPDRPTSDPVSSLRITITLQPMETYHSTLTGVPDCPPVPPPDFDAPRWELGFYDEHPGFTFPGIDFVRDAPPVFAIAVYGPRTINVDGETISENTLIEIVHTPLPSVPLPGATAG